MHWSLTSVAEGERPWYAGEMQRQVLGAILLGSFGCGGNGGEPTASSVTTVAMTTNGPSPTNGSDATVGESTATNTEPTDSDNSTTPAENGPKFISLQVNVMKLTAGQSVIFTAIVTDPDGLGDIAGGSLSSEDGVIGYGPFMAAGQEGTYTIEVTWAGMHQAESIEFVKSELIRTFRVDFYDQAAHKATKTVDLTLFCAEGSACDGECIDVDFDGANCGQCGKTCKDACGNASCLPVHGECINVDSGYASCDAYCVSIGEACVENGCEFDATIRAYGSIGVCMDDIGRTSISEPCDTVQPWTVGRQAVQCCCSDTQ